MRAITGAVVSSKPCSLYKAYHALKAFYESSDSDFPSADCDTYLSTVIEATREHELFRRGLRANLQQDAANLQAHDYEGGINHQDRKREGDMAVPAGGSQRDSAAEVEPDVAAGEKKSKKKKNKEDRQQGIAAAGVESHIPSPVGIGSERRKKEKHSNKEVLVHVKQEPDLVVDEELLSEKKSKKKKEKGRVKLEDEVRDVNEVGGKIVNDGGLEQNVAGGVDEGLLSEKKSKKKKEKGRVKLEDEARDVNEVGGKIVNDGGLEQNVAGGEKKRKKKKHEEQQVNFKDVKQEEKMVSAGGLDSEKKRKKKRGRGDNEDNALGQVEHTKKKQRK